MKYQLHNLTKHFSISFSESCDIKRYHTFFPEDDYEVYSLETGELLYRVVNNNIQNNLAW